MVELQLDSKTVGKQRIAVWALVGVNALWGLSFPIMRSLHLQMEQFFGLSNDSVPSSLSVAFSSGMIGMRFLAAFLLLFLVCPNLVRSASKAEWRAGVLVGLMFYVGLVWKGD